MDIITPINQSIVIAKRLREISKNIADAEFQNLVAELYVELADAKANIAELKTQNASLREENLSLTKQLDAEAEKPTVVRECYKFDGDDSLYCTSCFDTEKVKVRTKRVNENVQECPSCKNSYRHGNQGRVAVGWR